VQDETGLYTETNKMRKVAETQRRGAAGMGGRTLETTNCWDPSENSVAQTTFESQRKDIFRFYRRPPAKADGTQLSYLKKRERRQIHEYVYAGSWWVNLDSIEAEAAELIETDPAQAERFFGNRIVQGAGAYYPDGLWERAEIKDRRSEGHPDLLGLRRVGQRRLDGAARRDPRRLPVHTDLRPGQAADRVEPRRVARLDPAR
jgi:hypothetical protein